MPEPDEDDANEDARDNAQTANEAIEKKNEELSRLKSFVKFVTPLEDEPAISS